jgi:hypothetical protein
MKGPSGAACDKMNQANGVDTDKLEKSSEEVNKTVGETVAEGYDTVSPSAPQP